MQVGPLACELDGFAAWLATQGYARQTGENKLRLVRHLSLWLGSEGLGAEALDEERDDRQIVDDRRWTQTALVDEKVLVGALDPRDRVVAARVFGSVGDPASTAQMG